MGLPQTRPGFRFTTWAALVLAGAVLQGCAEKPAPVAAARQPQLFATDFQGAAKRCTVPKVTLETGKTVEAGMKIGSGGGWCAISVAHDDAPYAAGLLTRAPEHGKVYIHPVGDDTRIDYTPALGFTGTDSFVVTLLPGRPALHVAVTVVP
jgi:hypothetical protein